MLRDLLGDTDKHATTEYAPSVLGPETSSLPIFPLVSLLKSSIFRRFSSVCSSALLLTSAPGAAKWAESSSVKPKYWVSVICESRAV